MFPNVIYYLAVVSYFVETSSLNMLRRKPARRLIICQKSNTCDMRRHKILFLGDLYIIRLRASQYGTFLSRFIHIEASGSSPYPAISRPAGREQVIVRPAQTDRRIATVRATVTSQATILPAETSLAPFRGCT